MSTRFARVVESLEDILSFPQDAGIGIFEGMPWIRTSSGLMPLTGVAPSKSRLWWVDTVAGDDDANSGLAPLNAFQTMAAAFENIRSGDKIAFYGNVREQLTTPVQVFDVEIIGMCNRPRHADATPANGDYAASTWKAPASPTAATPLLKVLQQGWRFRNILWAGPTDAACVQLFRDLGAGDLERDASHAEFWNNRFASGQDGIQQSGGAGHVGIYGNFFTSLTGVAIKHTTGAGAGFPIRYEIVGNRFTECPSIMTAVAAFDYSIQGNNFMFTAAPTLVFDFTGGARNNVGGTVRNSFNIAAANFDPAGGVTGSGATDVWSNTLTDAIETGLPAN